MQFYRKGEKYMGISLLVSLETLLKMRKKGWTKFLKGTSATHGCKCPRNQQEQ